MDKDIIAEEVNAEYLKGFIYPQIRNYAPI